MTFYEAALRILESEGRPLHFLEITEKSIAQNLLSHVGKTPEMTMLSRLAAMARRTRDRKVIVTAKDTFALTDWSLLEDAEALAQTGVVEAHPEEELPPLRPVERHPEPRGDHVRVAGRGSERKRRRRTHQGGYYLGQGLLSRTGQEIHPVQFQGDGIHRRSRGFALPALSESEPGHPFPSFPFVDKPEYRWLPSAAHTDLHFCNRLKFLGNSR
jgi:hypothetical protein